jgi:predicted permease
MITIILILVIIGVALYMVENYIPMSPPIKTIIRVIVVILLVLWLLKVFGVNDIPIPKVN